MKIVINYDFFDAVLNTCEKLTPMKIVRNNKKLFINYCSLFFILNYEIIRNIPRSLFVLMLQNSGFFAINYGYAKRDNTDIYKELSIRRLKKLISEFKKQYIETNYDLLLNSELLKKQYKVYLNEHKIPELIENKFILVPTNDFNNNVKNISIKQEHIVGSNEYVLSFGSPEGKLSFAYSH